MSQQVLVESGLEVGFLQAFEAGTMSVMRRVQWVSRAVGILLESDLFGNVDKLGLALGFQPGGSG